ncbi:MAG: NADH-quinone oxidoreductase subunit D [Chloroflexi bacterium]|nr:NADH-quinone oxidoreductase subunit D [Chloroflexota bacterium]
METDQVVINMGPHHPSTHGVLRIILTLDGETIVDAEAVLGYLHRGFEKLCEEGTYLQNVSLTDRLDYLASMTNNWAYVTAVEQLAGIEVPERAEYIRVVVGELQRIASHCAATGFFGNDLGTSFTPLMYGFREREKILDLFEMISGARLTYTYYRPGGVASDLPPEFIPAAKSFLAQMPPKIDEIEGLLTGNEIVLSRCKGIGVMPLDRAISYSLAGPNLRASGLAFDLRKALGYSVYPRLQFDVPTGKTGDTFDRYIVRVREMRESIKIARQAIDAIEQLPPGDFCTNLPINYRPPVGDALSRIEGPRGEIGFYIVSDGSIAPYRCHQRAPSFIALGVTRELLRGLKVADAVVALASLDPVMGEVDR